MKIWIGLDWPGSGSVWTYTISELDKLRRNSFCVASFQWDWSVLDICPSLRVDDNV